MHEFFFENLRNPAHNRRAGLMRQFSSGQLYSTITKFKESDVDETHFRHVCKLSAKTVYTQVYNVQVSILRGRREGMCKKVLSFQT